MRAMRPSKLLVVISAAAVACGIAVACQEMKSTSGAPETDDAVDTELVSYLSRARALHHEANLKEELGDHEGAIAAMTRLTAQPFSRAGTPEVEEVLADAFARRAELELSVDKLDDAQKSADQGLTHAKDPTYFRGHLVEVTGLLDESRGKALADAGHAGEAKIAREKALRELEEAIAIQDQVLKGILRSDAGERGDR